MKVLLDTHALVWALVSPELLSKKASNTIAQGEVIASVASLWELILKCRKRGALIADPIPWWEKFVTGSGIETLGIRKNHVVAIDGLPEIHTDPFDRILLAQSGVEGAALVSRDRNMRLYKMGVIW